MKAALVLLLSVSLVATGCTSPRAMTPGVTPVSSRTQPHANERVKITMKSGATRELKLTSMDEQTITGVEGKGAAATTVQIATADVQSVEFRRFSLAKTAGLQLLIAAGVVVVALGTYLIACDNNKCVGE